MITAWTQPDIIRA